MARSPYEVPCGARASEIQPHPHMAYHMGQLTAGREKPKAEPKTMARRASQPRPNLAVLGMRPNGLETRGPQTAATGLLTTELGINRKAMILWK